MAPLLPSHDLDIARFRSETTHQLTTFDLDRRSKTLAVPHGEKVSIGEVEGRGYIAGLWMTFPGWFWQHWNQAAPVDQSILKTLILRIYWDGSDEPAVEAPVGDFFGIGLCEVANFTSKYFGMSSGGFFCKFPMPFTKGFRIEVENLDEKIDTDIFMNVMYQLDETTEEERGFFHARFATAQLSGSDPLPLAHFEGRGHYVGCTLSMQCEDQGVFFCLEAPEQIWIDDDWERPRIYGTGLEDYFLGGWYFREGTFSGPLHGVPVKDALNASVAMYRVHEAEAIRFDRRFRMEFVNPFDPGQLRPYAFSAVAFAYLDKPEGAGNGLPPRDELLCWYRVRNCDHQSIP